MPLFRIDWHGWYGDLKTDRAYNMLAGSIMFLDPGTAYEVRLSLADKDGGKMEKTPAKVFLLRPTDTDMSDDEKARLAERGLYN